MKAVNQNEGKRCNHFLHPSLWRAHPHEQVALSLQPAPILDQLEFQCSLGSVSGQKVSPKERYPPRRNGINTFTIEVLQVLNNV